MAVYLAFLKQIGALRRQQEMVDPDAFVALPGAPLKIPESEVQRRAVPDAERIGVAQI